MNRALRITRSVLNAIDRHARGCAPEECCGILLASDPASPTADEALPARNAEPTQPERRYLIGHEAHLEAVTREAAGTGQIVAYYHSHPKGTAMPSGWDEQNAVEGVRYLIAGMGGGETQYAAWECVEGRLVPAPLEITEG